MQIHGYVLAGGQSSRMGEDKAFLEVAGKTFLELALERLRAIGLEPIILSGPSSEVSRAARLGTFAQTVTDLYPRSGPLGGIVTALYDAFYQGQEDTWALIIPIDQPLLPASLLQRWVAEVTGGDLSLVASETAASGRLASWMESSLGIPEPLPILLRTELRVSLERELQAGNRRLLPTILTCAKNNVFPWLPPRELVRPGCFLNLNTPEDVNDLSEFERVLETEKPFSEL